MTALVDEAQVAACGCSSVHEAIRVVDVVRMPETGPKFDRWLDLVPMQHMIETA